MSTEPLEDLVWTNTVDQGKFTCQVIRTGDHRGQLRVAVAGTGESLLNEEVGLSYDAIFGPDAADVMEWQDKSIDVIDEWIEKQKG